MSLANAEAISSHLAERQRLTMGLELLFPARTRPVTTERLRVFLPVSTAGNESRHGHATLLKFCPRSSVDRAVVS